MNKQTQPTQWWQRGNFYSVYIDAFAGDIKTFTNRLDYFVDLGIDCIHILPHYPSMMRDDGFDITDHTGVRAALGTVADFELLCTTAHDKGLKIMVDLVLNHVSSDHPWFVEARADKHNPKRDWFLWSDTGTEFADAPVIFPEFKTSNWQWNEQTTDYYYTTFKPSQPELNWSNPDVQAAMLQVVDELVVQGVDGFRLDAVMNLVEQEGTTSVSIPATHDRVKDIRTHLDTNHPGTILLGEVVGTTDYSKQYFGSSDECHLSYNFELMNEMLYALICGTNTDRLKTAIEAARAVPTNTTWLAFLRNHDSLSFVSLSGEKVAKVMQAVDPDHTYGFKNNTETAQRLASLLHDNQAKIIDAFTMLLSLPTATVLYYGDEIGMQNAALPAGDDDMRTVVRAPFDWAEATRQQADHHSLYHTVRQQLLKRKSSNQT